MDNGSINHHTRCRHDTVTHDRRQILDLFQLYRHAFIPRDLLDERHRVLAVGATCAENFHFLHMFLLVKKLKAFARRDDDAFDVLRRRRRCSFAEADFGQLYLRKVGEAGAFY